MDHVGLDMLRQLPPRTPEGALEAVPVVQSVSGFFEVKEFRARIELWESNASSRISNRIRFVQLEKSEQTYLGGKILDSKLALEFPVPHQVQLQRKSVFRTRSKNTAPLLQNG